MTESLLPTFEALVGRQFSMQIDETSAVELELTACDATRSADQTGFSLTFMTDAAQVEQGTYLVSTDGLDPMPIFLVPVAWRDSNLELQAIFAEPSAD